MTYARLDTRFPTHPKVAGLSDAAFRLHVSALCYAAEHLTDGLISADVLPTLRPAPAGRQRLVGELTGRMLWVELDGGAGWAVHDYLDWNWSRQAVEQRREVGRQSARKRWEPTR